jgi:hypothetical protein
METALNNIALNNIEGEMTESRAEVEGSSAAEPGFRTILEMHGAKSLAALAMLVIG